MSIWIIGPSGSGKSTLAIEVSRRIGMPVFEAGFFCRDACAVGAEYEVLADKAVELLRADHRYFSWRIFRAIQGKDLIIVGARNPVDFIESFDPSKDRVFMLYADSDAKPGFEKTGLVALVAIIKFFRETGIVQESQWKWLNAKKDQENWYEEIYSQL